MDHIIWPMLHRLCTILKIPCHVAVENQTHFKLHDILKDAILTEKKT